MPVADLTRLLDVLSAAAVADLVREYGGMEISVPKTAAGRTYAQLVDLLGDPAADALCRAYGGDRLTVPNLKARALAARNRQMRADYDAGAGLHDLVRQYRLCERQIRDLLNRTDDPGEAERRQMEMFE